MAKAQEPRRGSGVMVARAKARLEEPDVYAAGCPSRGVLEHITSQWGVLALASLTEGTHRFSELRKKIGGVSEKMLAQTLQALERDGFVRRVVFPVVPPRVEYSLTPMGTDVAQWVVGLTDWVEENLPRVNDARRRYARQESPRSAQSRASERR